MKFCSGGMLAAIRVKISDSEKKKAEQEHVRHFLHKTSNQKFLEVSRCSRAKQRQIKAYKKVCCTCKVSFLLIRPIFFTVPVAFTAWHYIASVAGIERGQGGRAKGRGIGERGQVTPAIRNPLCSFLRALASANS